MSGSPDSITGIILAGGDSSRMGENKALLPVRGRPMIELVAETMRGVFDPVWIIADEEEPYRYLGHPVFPDIIKRSGPLGGIHAGLTRSSPGGVFVLACDTPCISAELLRHLRDRRNGAGATVARHADGIHPLCGIYEHRALPVIEESLRTEKFAMLTVLDSLKASYVDITEDLPFYRADLFLNINDPRHLNGLSAIRHS